MTSPNDIAAEIARLRDVFAPHAHKLVPGWLPGGKKEGREWVALNPTRSDSTPGSFKINLQSGEWSDFATDDKGHDIISLRAYLNGNLGQKGAQVAAAKEIAAMLGVPAFGEGRGAANQKKQDEKLDWRHIKTWEYHNAEGGTVFEVARFEAVDSKGKRRKRFVQKHNGADGKPVYNVDGVEKVPYRLPELIEDIASDRVIFFVEGEKCVDAARKIGVPATCNPMGAGKWWPELTAHFRDADVVIIPDADEPGRKHAQLVGGNISPVARRVRVLDLATAARLAAKEDIFDWAQAGGAADALYEMAGRFAIPWQERPIVSSFGAIPFWELDRPGPEHEWLIKGILTRYERSLMAGESQAGKSFLALDMALAVARGIPYWERRTLRGGVIYQAGEGGLGLRKRIRAYRKHNEIADGERLPFILMPGVLDLHNGDGALETFIEECKRWGDTLNSMFELPLELAVIDTFAAATPGANENDVADMGRVLGRCARISEALRTHVMLVHHMNAQGSKPRGHTSIFANIDSTIQCVIDPSKKDEDGRPVREARLAKQKDGESGIKWNFVLRGNIEVGHDADGDPVTSCVVTPPAGRAATIGGRGAPSKYHGRLTDRQEIAMRALQEATLDFGQPAPPSLGLPQGIRVVKWAQWRARWAALSFDDEKSIQREAERIGRALLARRIIGKEGEWVWEVSTERGTYGGDSDDFGAEAA